jgi:hypothetical protein
MVMYRKAKFKNLKHKVLFFNKVKSHESQGKSTRFQSLRIQEIEEGSLVFENLLPQTTIQSLNKIYLFLKVGGKWRKHVLNNLTPQFNDPSAECTQVVDFSLNDDGWEDFRRDLILARV